MDPNANITEQRHIAALIQDKPPGASWQLLAARLAELVLALDGVTPSLSSSVECPDCGAEVDVRSARAL